MRGVQGRTGITQVGSLTPTSCDTFKDVGYTVYALSSAYAAFDTLKHTAFKVKIALLHSKLPVIVHFTCRLCCSVFREGRCDIFFLQTTAGTLQQLTEITHLERSVHSFLLFTLTAHCRPTDRRSQRPVHTWRCYLIHACSAGTCTLTYLIAAPKYLNSELLYLLVCCMFRLQRDQPLVNHSTKRNHECYVKDKDKVTKI